MRDWYCVIMFYSLCGSICMYVLLFVNFCVFIVFRFISNIILLLSMYLKLLICLFTFQRFGSTCDDLVMGHLDILNDHCHDTCCWILFLKRNVGPVLRYWYSMFLLFVHPLPTKLLSSDLVLGPITTATT